MNKIIFPGWIIASIALFLYSYTQVDLGLTLTEISIWQVIQTSFQQIGYFNRPLSTAFYLILLVLFFVLYIFSLRGVKSGGLTRRDLWKIILAVGVILLFSYNAFSYDLFNYIFDAKIVTHYGQNPYEHKALDYMGDPMLGFMHWTHRTYPYGPTWLLLTIPVSYTSSFYFLLTIYSFKAIMVLSYLGTVYYLEKILMLLKKEQALFGIAFFALHPLVLIESLVSAHHDIVMMFFAIFGFYLVLQRKRLWGFLSLLFSIGIKFVTIFLLPLIFIPKKYIEGKHKESFLVLLNLLMIMPIILASIRTNFQPWYLIFVLPTAALIADKKYVLVPTTIISFFSLLHYAPFLYLGNWDPPVPKILTWLTTSGIVLSSLIVFSYLLKRAKT